MRRFIAYIMMALSMLIAVGVAATPVLTKLNGGREFNSGREIVFNIDSKDEKKVDQDVAEEVATEMRERLNNWHIEDYSVKVQSNNNNDNPSYSVAVSIDAEKDVFNSVARYLSFSGENFSISGKDPETLRENVLNVEEAKIIYESDVVPVIVIPVTDSGKEDLEKLIEQINPTEASGGSTSAKRAPRLNHEGHEEGEEEGGEQETKEPEIFLWANHEEDDLIENESINPLIREKIIMRFYADQIWNEKAKEEHTEIKFICGSADETGNYDVSKLKDANLQANYYLNMLKASKYDYEITCPTRNVSLEGIDYYENALVAEPSMEKLLSFGNNVTIKLSTTLIATFIAFVIITLLLVVYYRVSAIGMVATTVGTLFITMLSFSSMNVLFNLPALIGLIILTIGSLFGQIVYVNRFKEEVYKGRSIKKANQEASRKSNLLTLDASIIMAFAGLMMYALGGTALKPMGVVLFFGAVFSLLINLIVFKILMYLLTNSTNLQTKYKVFNIEGSKVPNLMSQEEKEPYTSAYEKSDFTKKKKLSGIILGALTVAAVAVITVFGIKDGSPLNVANATKNSTVIYTSLVSENNVVTDLDSFKQYALKDVKVDENSSIAKDDIVTEMKEVSTYIYEDSTTQTTEKTYYFISKIDADYNETQLAYIEQSISDALNENIPGKFEITVQTTKELNYTPDQGSVALATAITIVGACFYMALRFRPSRGIAALVVSAGATTIAYGLFVGIRVGTTAVTSLAMPIVAVSSLILSLFYVATEKAMVKENRNELSFEDRKAIMVKALGKAASPMLVLALITLYLSVNYFGFGINQTAFLFASALVGEIISIIAILTIMGPLACVIGKLFNKINMPKLKMFAKKDKPNTSHKRNSSEPEETIFIGIND